MTISILVDPEKRRTILLSILYISSRYGLEEVFYPNIAAYLLMVEDVPMHYEFDELFLVQLDLDLERMIGLRQIGYSGLRIESHIRLTDAEAGRRAIEKIGGDKIEKIKKAILNMDPSLKEEWQGLE